MANVTETPSYDAGIYQIETTDPVLGGPNGIANAQAKGLANRTAFLKHQIDQLTSGQITPAWIASQDYVQEQLQKLDAKQSVRAATTANITLSGVQTIDGVALTVGDRVLVKDQTAAAQNGIYLAAAQGWTRSSDADNSAKLSSGARISVEEGTVNSGCVWYLSTTGTINIGSTAIVFENEHKNASETVRGLISVATQQQTTAGAADDVAVTPKKMRMGFNFIASANGFIALPSWLGGFIIQWGSVPSIQAGGNAVITYPTVFPSALFATIPIAGSNGCINAILSAGGGNSLASFQALNNLPGAMTTGMGVYIAVGR